MDAVEELEQKDSVNLCRTMAMILVIASLIVVVDQFSKDLVVQRLTLFEEISVIPDFFNITLVYNAGVAFGMGANLSAGVRQVVLSIATLLAIAAILYFLIVDYLHDRIAQIAIALIFGGAAGNIIDRVRIGRVVDFLDFYMGAYHWPAFNVADSAICIGVVVLIFRRPGSSVPVSASSSTE